MSRINLTGKLQPSNTAQCAVFKDCINDEKQFVSASVLYSTLHLNVFGPINKEINKDSHYIYQLYRLSTLSHWTLDLPTVSFSRKDADFTVYHMESPL